MSEASGASQVAYNPATGEVVGGLAGLREIIRMKNEIMNGNTSESTDEKATAGQLSAGAGDDQASGVTTNKSKRRRNRRRRRNNTSDDASASQTGQPNSGNKNDSPVSDDEWQLPIDRQQIVYGEIIKKDAEIDDVRLFVSSDDKLYVYTSALYPDNVDEYKKAAAKLLSSQATFAMGRVAKVQLFINKQAHLTVGQDSLVYLDEYRIDSSNERVFAMAKKLLNNQQTDDQPMKSDQSGDKTNEVASADDGQPNEQSADEPAPTAIVTKVFHFGETAGDIKEIAPEQFNKPTKDAKSNQRNEADKSSDNQATKPTTNNTKPVQKPTADNKNSRDKETDTDVSARVLKALKLAKQIAKDLNDNKDVKINRIMEVILLVGKVSSAILADLLDTDEAAADDYIDRLRLMHALGYVRADGTYPILINKLSDLGKDVSYTLASEADNFRSVVHYEVVRGKKLVYDLDQVFMLKLADEYIQQVAEYCRATNSSDIKRLFDSATGEVKLSEVLQTISGDDTHEALNTSEYDLFHRYVTKYMIAAGWVSPNPTDGFPWLQLQVASTNGLTIDTMRYISSNLSWISCIYTDDILLSLAKQLSDVTVPAIHGGYSLQQILCGEIRQRVAILNREERDGVYQLNPNQLSLTDSAESNKIEKNEKSGSSANHE